MMLSIIKQSSPILQAKCAYSDKLLDCDSYGIEYMVIVSSSSNSLNKIGRPREVLLDVHIEDHQDKA